MNTLQKIIFAAMLFGLSGVAGADEAVSDKPHWSYQGETGPERWGQLSPAYAMCSQGKNQSPIDIHGGTQALLPALDLNYTADGSELINNGHAIQLNFKPGSTLKIDGITFNLRQLHFHTPSENTINGTHYPMEAHLVHADADGNLAIVAIMYERGAANSLLGQLWPVMPKEEGGKVDVAAGITAKELLGSDLSYWRFNGSLTTPPCSEGVRWLVLHKTQTASLSQIREYREVMHGATNRPVQPLNARVILK